MLGTVTTQASSTVAAGNVISESPIAGTSVNAGSAVNLVVSSGVGSLPPVSIAIQVAENLITAGGSTSFTATALDSNGNPVSGVTPTCAISADPSATGTAPTIASGNISTDATTRGVYTLTCSLSAPALTAVASLVVLPPADPTVTTQDAILSAFSGTVNSSATALDQIKAALTASNAAGVNTGLAQLQAAFNTFSLSDLSGVAAFAPEGGFPADPSALPSFGINPTAQDANVGPYLSNLIGALQNVTTFLQTTPLATATTAQKTEFTNLETALAALVAQLPTLNPSAYGVVANTDQEDKLMNTVLRQYYQALTSP